MSADEKFWTIVGLVIVAIAAAMLGIAGFLIYLGIE